jgi:hypothetical protein
MAVIAVMEQQAAKDLLVSEPARAPRLLHPRPRRRPSRN